MWYFRSPQIVFGEDALDWIKEEMKGKKAFIVTDPGVRELGFLQIVQHALTETGLESAFFDQVEPDPCLETALAAAQAMLTFEPDWVIGLGGGSSLDTAKAAWFHYTKPEIDLSSMNIFEQYGLHSKARFLTIPTTAGSGAEVTAAAIITDNELCQKLELNSYELVADVTLVDPRFTLHLPPQLTAITGIDSLSHAIEGYSATLSNDFSDGLCLQAARLVFHYLPLAIEEGANDPEAREKLANAATMAGLGISNSHVAMAHAMGHSIGTLFHIPHGRAIGISLPVTIEFIGQYGHGRYRELAEAAGCQPGDECQAAFQLAESILGLMQTIHMPLSLQEAGIPAEDFFSQLEALCERAMTDPSLATSRRLPTWEELEKLFRYAYEGKRVDF